MLKDYIIKHLGINNVEMQKKAQICLNLKVLKDESKIIRKDVKN